MEFFVLLLMKSSGVILGTLFLLVILRAAILRASYCRYRSAGGGYTFLEWSRIRRSLRNRIHHEEWRSRVGERERAPSESPHSVDLTVDFSVWYRTPEERTGTSN